MSDRAFKLPKALTRVDGVAGWRHLILHLLVIAGLMTLTLGLSRLFALPLGLALGALFPVMHEATHRHIFTRPRANARLAFACGLILAISATWFRHFHQAHHRFTQDPARDPELAQPKPSTRWGYLWHVSGLPAWASALRLLGRQALGQAKAPFVPVRQEAHIVAEARLIVLAHAAILACGVWQPVLLWISYLPLAVGQMFLRFFLLAEHGGLPLVDRVLDNTRTTRAGAPLRWLTWNMSFHIEHHANPAVPHDKLPDFHRQLRPQTCASYVRFHQGYWTKLRNGHSRP